MPNDNYTTNVEAAAHEARDFDGVAHAHDFREAYDPHEDDIPPVKAHHYEVPVCHEDFAPTNPHTFDPGF